MDAHLLSLLRRIEPALDVAAARRSGHEDHDWWRALHAELVAVLAVRPGIGQVPCDECGAPMPTLSPPRAERTFVCGACDEQAGEAIDDATFQMALRVHSGGRVQ